MPDCEVCIDKYYYVQPGERCWSCSSKCEDGC